MGEVEVKGREEGHAGKKSTGIPSWPIHLHLPLSG